jgi:predicted RNase H-like HicB family nuclease
MEYKIFIQNPAEHHFTASVLGLPACVAEGATREEVLVKDAVNCHYEADDRPRLIRLQWG